MDEPKLPDKIIPITMLRVRWDKKKKCTCQCRSFVVDMQNKEVTCEDCGFVVQPFEAIAEMAIYCDRLNSQIESLLKQKQELENWKPHLRRVREIEKIYRSKDMIPSCPHCGIGIEIHEYNGAVNRKYDQERRKFLNKDGGGR
jgi:hypothetical protein